jgi:hypothetical protein
VAGGLFSIGGGVRRFGKEGRLTFILDELSKKVKNSKRVERDRKGIN